MIAALLLGLIANVSAQEISDSKSLIKALRDPRAERRAEAQAVLSKAEPAMIADLLRTGGSIGRREAHQRLVVRMGRKAIATLLHLLDDAELGVTAGSTLVMLVGGRDYDLIPKLADCAANKPQVRNYCATALLNAAGPAAAPHARALSGCLNADDAQIRAYCAAALQKVGTKAAPAVDSLIAALGDSNSAVRQKAAAALGAIGKSAAKAVPALTKASTDDSPEVRKEAKAALRRVRA